MSKKVILYPNITKIRTTKDISAKTQIYTISTKKGLHIKEQIYTAVWLPRYAWHSIHKLTT